MIIMSELVWISIGTQPEVQYQTNFLHREIMIEKKMFRDAHESLFV